MCKATKFYELIIGDPYGARGPKEIDSITVRPLEIVRRPTSPGWQSQYILSELVPPISYQGELVVFVLVSPRYVGESLDDVLSKEVTVGVGRVLPGKVVSSRQRFEASDIHYWAIGAIRRVYT